MDHNTMFQLQGWVRSQRKMFQSRMAIVMLVIVNFTNSTILSLKALGPESIASVLVFLVNTVVVCMALVGIYKHRPILLTPNVVTKVALSSAALFYGLQLAETNDSASACLFVWLLSTVFLFIWEIQAMFSATFGIIKQINDKAHAKPPPSYDTVVEADGPPTYQEAVSRCPVHSLNAATLAATHSNTVQMV